MTDAGAALDWLCNPASAVSAHYLVGCDGQIVQMVREADRAWHAGVASWGGAGDVNSRSVGVELVNSGSAPFAAPQIRALERLLPGIMARHGIGRAGVIAHSDCALGRKVDPGPRFDWRRLALGGLSVWPGPPTPAEPAGDWRADARRFGYDSDDDAALLAAFRLRFRPDASGPADDRDRAMLADLARRFAVDRA